MSPHDRDEKADVRRSSAVGAAGVSPGREAWVGKQRNPSPSGAARRLSASNFMFLLTSVIPWVFTRRPLFDRYLFVTCRPGVAPLGLETIGWLTHPSGFTACAATPPGWANLCRASGARSIDAHAFLTREESVCRVGAGKLGENQFGLPLYY